MLKKWLSESGRTMVETLTTLAFIGLLTVGAVTGFRYAMEVHKENQSVDWVVKTIVGSRTGFMLEKYGEEAEAENKDVSVPMPEVISGVDFNAAPGVAVPYTYTTPLASEVSVRVINRDAFEVDMTNVSFGVCQKLLRGNLEYKVAYVTNAAGQQVLPSASAEAKEDFCRLIDENERKPSDPGDVNAGSLPLTLCFSQYGDACGVDDEPNNGCGQCMQFDAATDSCQSCATLGLECCDGECAASCSNPEPDPDPDPDPDESCAETGCSDGLTCCSDGVCRSNCNLCAGVMCSATNCEACNPDTGACETTCPSGTGCCGNGTCSADCGGGTIIGGCSTSDDCTGSCEQCINGTCTVPDNITVCGTVCCDTATESCVGGACCSVANVCGNSCCGDGEECVNGVCQEPEPECTRDEDCAGCAYCSDGSCVSGCQDGKICCQDACIEQPACDGGCETFSSETCACETTCSADEACCSDVCTSTSCPEGYTFENCACVRVCEADETVCGDDCCAAGLICNNGVCEAQCAADETVCGTNCCAANQVCNGGVCQDQCVTGQTACGNDCCESNETCNNGVCEVKSCTADGDCGDNQACCDNSCVLTTCADGYVFENCACVKECGEGETACGDTCCAAGEICNDGVCGARPCEGDDDCGENQACCDSVCTSTTTCADGYVFENCACVKECGEGETACGDTCCAAGEICRADGTCATPCTSNADCGEGTCENGVCTPPTSCTSGDDCEDGWTCVDGTCTSGGGGSSSSCTSCTDASACGEDETCCDGCCVSTTCVGDYVFDSGVCACVPTEGSGGAPTCSTGWFCADGFSTGRYGPNQRTCCTNWNYVSSGGYWSEWCRLGAGEYSHEAACCTEDEHPCSSSTGMGKAWCCAENEKCGSDNACWVALCPIKSGYLSCGGPEYNSATGTFSCCYQKVKECWVQVDSNGNALGKPNC